MESQKQVLSLAQHEWDDSHLQRQTPIQKKKVNNRENVSKIMHLNKHWNKLNIARPQMIKNKRYKNRGGRVLGELVEKTNGRE